MRAIEGKIFSHLSFKDNKWNDISEVAKSEGLIVNSFEELVEKVARLSFHNKDYLLFYRGQKREHLNRSNNSSFYPSIYRTLPNENLTPDMLNNRFWFLDNVCKKLIEKFEENSFDIKELKKRPFIQWSILQHYEVCGTPLLDLTQSIRAAASFALLDNKEGNGYFYVFGLPYISNRISRNSEHEIVNIRLLNICPPEAIRPYFQEGYLVGTDDITTEYDDKTEFDLKRRLLAKFRIPTKNFWGNESPINEDILMPSTDRMKEICDSIKAEMDYAVSPENIFPGVWMNEYSFPDGRSGSESVQIKDGDKYYSNGRLMFTIDLVQKNDNQLRFRKVGIGSDKRKAINDLTIINDREYRGIEDGGNRIRYYRIE